MSAGARAIVQLVPGAPPQINGVGDFALAIAKRLRTDMGIESRFIVCNPGWQGRDELDGFAFARLPERAALYDLLLAPPHADLPIVLQLSPYGFERNGCPFWLLRCLTRMKQAHPQRRLTTYFHELFATSAPWRRGFWLSPFQRACARGIARASDRSLATIERHARILRRWRAPGSAEAALCTPSGVGEPATTLPVSRRERQLVVFGSLGLRARAYSRAPGGLGRICRMLEVKRVLDVGPGDPGACAMLDGIGVSKLGVLAPERVSEILSQSQFGYVDYYGGYLGKSSIFGAYAAHAMVPVTAVNAASDEDGIVAGRQYWCPELGPLGEERAERISGEARSWYARHDVSAHARALAGAIEEPAP